MPPTVVANCPACGSTNARVAAAISEVVRQRFLAFSRLKYRGVMDGWLHELTLSVLRCRACGHCWYGEQPDQAMLFSMYEAAVPRFPNPAGVIQDEAIMGELARFHRVCRTGRASLTLLDFGSGFGRWPRAGAEAGFTVCAFEPSQTRGRAEETPFELVHDLSVLRGRSFDAINVEQVLEHVPDPLATLQQINALCAPHSVVRITVPNILRPYEGKDVWAVWPFDGTRTHTLAPFEHLHGFTPRSLNKLIARAGFGSASRTRLWRYYPLGQLRSLVGNVVPSLGSTFRLISPARVAGSHAAYSPYVGGLQSE